MCRTNASDADRCHADGGSTYLGGSPVNVSVNHMWSYVEPGDPYSFAVDGRAALGFASPKRWSAYAGVGGYFNTPDSYLSDAISATELRLSTRTPSSWPPLSSICEKRR